MEKKIVCSFVICRHKPAGEYRLDNRSFNEPLINKSSMLTCFKKKINKKPFQKNKYRFIKVV